MVPRPLGRTGLRVTAIGYGAFKIGRNEGIKYPAAYELPDDKATAALLHGVLDAGINYIDTAPAYGLSEERIGNVLSGRRAEFVLSTKVGETFTGGRSTYDFSAGAVRASVERSLRRLRTEVIDILFIHAHAQDVDLLVGTDLVETLQRAREQGWVRAIGFSGKTVAAAELALSFADVLMIEYHLKDRSHAPVIEAAARRGVGVVIKKGLQSGWLHAGAAIEFVLRTPGVGSLLIGGLDLGHIQANVRLAEALSEEEPGHALRR